MALIKHTGVDYILLSEKAWSSQFDILSKVNIESTDEDRMVYFTLFLQTFPRLD